MPIEIREVSINLTLLAENGRKNSNETEGNEVTLSEGMQRRLVDACVRAVLRILRDKNEP